MSRFGRRVVSVLFWCAALVVVVVAGVLMLAWGGQATP